MTHCFLTRRWRRRATAYALWQARVCTVWPAPQLGRACAVHAVMLGGARPLSRSAWSRRTREAQGRLRAAASAGSGKRPCGARDTHRIRGGGPSGRAGTRPQSPPATGDGAVDIRRRCTDGMTAYRGRPLRCLGLWRATELGCARRKQP